MPTDADTFFQSLEAAGEDVVRVELATHIYNERRSTLAREWLARKERSRQEEAATLDHDRKAEELSLTREALAAAKESNRIASENLVATRESAASAKKQARWAIWSAVVAVVAALVAASDAITKLVSSFI